MPGAPAGPPLTRRETSAGEGFLESDPSKNICGSGNISMGLGTSPDSQRGSWGSDPTFQAPISLCVAASPCRASHHPPGLQFPPTNAFSQLASCQACELVDLRVAM